MGAPGKRKLAFAGDATRGEGLPYKLNFAFEGLATFVFRHWDGNFRREVILRFGQESGSGAYPWYMGSTPFHCDISDFDGLVCGELSFFRGNRHKYYVYPRPI
ncbi:hypothetical protein AK812_SmicGene30346 [Symbiodinium microadriaticum]|uniref:Uncharacterized protein n=1 Tax=Symbiodinium microadriaticum TaxID=2951 RepID=A0A1Q9CZL5_SYMMI|nr:hypothetical protein AK812_SmicGene30346 [Symbiodinium microadriaticum]